MKNKYKKSGRMTEREQQRILGSKGSNIEQTGKAFDALLNKNKLSGLGSQLTEAEIKRVIKNLTK